MTLLTDLTERMDPELRAVFTSFPPAVDAARDPQGAREAIERMAEAHRRAPSPTVARRDVTVPGPADHPDLMVRVYEPAGRSGALPAMLYLHGGGFITGSVPSSDSLCDRLVDAVGAVVVSVEYRRAPEHPHPAAVEDAYAALRWIASSADELGVDPARIAAVGHSAGGGIAAGVALLARDRGEIALALQAPICACLDDRHVTPSSRMVGDRRTWYRERALRAWAAYLGEPGADVPSGVDVSPYAAPSRAEDLSGLPPAVMVVGELDLVRDENLEYARRLVEAGVPAELHLYSGAFHGFELMLPESQLGAAAWRALETALRRLLHAPEGRLAATAG